MTLRCVDLCGLGCLPFDDQVFEPEAAVRGGELLLPRLSRAEIALQGAMRLHYERKGAIGSLSIVALDVTTTLPPLAPHDASLTIRAIGLNFRDVLNVLGEYPVSCKI